MRAAGDGAHGRRLRGLIVILWRAGLRVQEALALTQADLDQRRGSLLVRRGKGDPEVGMDDWGWKELQPWLERPARVAHRAAVLCHQRSDGRPTVGNRGRPRSSGAPPPRPGCAATARAVEMAREGVPLIV